MPEFLTLFPPSEALQRLMQRLPTGSLLAESVETRNALGRVTAIPVLAPHPLPTFPRSTVDGFAVRANDTYGASDSLPIYFTVVGEVPMGSTANLEIASTQAALIHTGGMLPDGSDAVVMVEHTQTSRKDEIEVLRAVAQGENILRVGEDVSAGDEVIPAGRRIRPVEIGGLNALGMTHVTVVCKPRVGIISSGDEVVSPEKELLPGQVRDINAYTLGALVQDTGGIPVNYGILPDQADALLEVASRALSECEAIVITAGSSASTRDLTAQVINTLGEPGVLVHGINIRPGKPTILAVCNGKPVIGLPGNPVSALIIASLFFVPVIEYLLNLSPITGDILGKTRPFIRARLTVNVPSQAGREDWFPVRLIASHDGYIADPIFGKSNLIFTLARADGLVCIPLDTTGFNTDEMVDVIFFQAL